MNQYAVWDNTGKIIYRIAGKFKPESFAPYTAKGLSWGEFATIDGATHIINGVPTTVPPSVAELLAAIRTERDQRLTACDWTQLPDAPTDKAAWAVYRQKLRDMPECCDPSNPIWPIPPV